MENYIPIIGTLLGTILGFVLGLIKEYIQSKPNLKTELKTGKIYYYVNVIDEIGNHCSYNTPVEEANRLYLLLRFDIFNIGKAGTGITDISIKLQTKRDHQYYFPKLTFPIENKELENTSFNIEANTVQTVEAELVFDKDENSYLFEDNILDPDNKNKLRITVIVGSMGKKQDILKIEPFSILYAQNHGEKIIPSPRK